MKKILLAISAFQLFSISAFAADLTFSSAPQANDASYVFGQHEAVSLWNIEHAGIPVTVGNFPGIINIGNTVTIKPTGAANTANGQVTASTSAATLKAANSTRRSISIVNTDTTITVYIGIATVTTANGFPLKAGQSISVDNTGLIQVIAASGSPVVAYLETYD